MTEIVNFIARTVYGEAIQTFETRDLAMTWAEIEGWRFPGWTISRETSVTLTRSVVLRRDRSQLSECA